MTSVELYNDLMSSTAFVRSQVIHHQLYSQIKTLKAIRIFMEHHVFAVWDFMSLLTMLRRQLTCLDVPWRPCGDPSIRRLLNEIVLEEESDLAAAGFYTSHMELYLRAMDDCGADTSRIKLLLSFVAANMEIKEALSLAQVPAPARLFVETTWDILSSHSLHRIAAAFTVGREKVIPDMFCQIVQDLDKTCATELTTFADYLNRHIELDKERHSPMALEMLKNLCGNDTVKWKEAADTAKHALHARLTLWDSITDQLSHFEKHTHAL